MIQKKNLFSRIAGISTIALCAAADAGAGKANKR